MQNGCNCCTIQSDLVEELIGLTQMKNEDKEMKFNYILIEALGISEPHEIARNNWDAERRGIKNWRGKEERVWGNAMLSYWKAKKDNWSFMERLLWSNVFFWNAPTHVSSYFRVNSQFWLNCQFRRNFKGRYWRLAAGKLHVLAGSLLGCVQCLTSGRWPSFEPSERCDMTEPSTCEVFE